MPVYRLDPNRVPIFWDLVKPGLILGQNISGIDGDANFANKVLEKSLAGACQIWIGFELGEPTGDTYVGFGITYIVNDMFMHTKDLILYFIYTYKPPSATVRNETIISLYKYAKAQKCTRLVTYTDNMRMDKVIKDTFGQFVKERHMYYVKLEEV